MKKRAHQRILVGLDGEAVHKDTRYAAFIGDISEKGLCAIITPMGASGGTPSEEEIELTCNIAPGKVLKMRCRERWSNLMLPERATRRIGMEIMNPPEMLAEYIHSISNFS